VSAHVILTAGHRNRTGGGTPGEQERTPRFARAYVSALRAAGHTVHYIQSLDDAKDARPDFYSGTLDDVAARVVSIANGIAGDAIVMLDLHIEDGAAPRGCFAEGPDDPTGQPAAASATADVWKNNERTRAIGASIISAMSAATGILVRTATTPGLMSERVTAVGAKGSRLAMFRRTAPLRDRMVRLLVEHGNIEKDRALLDAPETPMRCGRAVAEVLTEVFGARGLIAKRD
jgi:hypothetical protein